MSSRCASRLTSSSLNPGLTFRQQLAHWVQSIPAHTRRVASKTRVSISSADSLHLVFRKRRKREFSSSFFSPPDCLSGQDRKPLPYSASIAGRANPKKSPILKERREMARPERFE